MSLVRKARLRFSWRSIGQEMHGDCMILSMRFPQKLWRIVNECGSGAIGWSPSGTSILLDYKRFQEEYLDACKPVFKTSNMTSFIRQLNLYGFRKVTAHNREQGSDSRIHHVHEFLHESFQSGRPDLLVLVRRKAASKPKDFQARDSILSTSDETEEQDGINIASPLEMCRLQLRRELRQIRSQYRQLHNYESRSENSDSEEIRCAKGVSYFKYYKNSKVHEC